MQATFGAYPAAAFSIEVDGEHALAVDPLGDALEAALIVAPESVGGGAGEQVAIGILAQGDHERIGQAVFGAIVAQAPAIPTGEPTASSAEPEPSIYCAMHGTHGARTQAVAVGEMDEGIAGVLAQAAEACTDPDGAAAILRKAAHQVVAKAIRLAHERGRWIAIQFGQVQQSAGRAEPEVAIARAQHRLQVRFGQGHWEAAHVAQFRRDGGERGVELEEAIGGCHYNAFAIGEQALHAPVGQGIARHGPPASIVQHEEAAIGAAYGTVATVSCEREYARAHQPFFSSVALGAPFAQHPYALSRCSPPEVVAKGQQGAHSGAWTGLRNCDPAAMPLRDGAIAEAHPYSAIGSGGKRGYLVVRQALLAGELLEPEAVGARRSLRGAHP